MERKLIKAHARSTVQKNLVMAVGLFLIPVAVQVVISTLFSFLGSFGGFLGSVFNFVLTAFVSIGYAQAYLRLNRQQNGALEDLLAGVSIWERSILYQVWYWFFSVAWTIIPTIIMILAFSLGGFAFLSGGSGTLQVGTLIVAMIASFSLSMLALFVQIRYGFAAYLLIEEPNLDPKACITRSKNMVKGHYWELICFYFSFIWWFLLSTVTFGIAGLFVIPYILTAYAGVYDSFREQELVAKAPIDERVPNPTPVS
ncbi:MAG: DUF975 family protein [Culicoidibacterales bacterium]